MTDTTPPACWSWPVPEPDAHDPKLPPAGDGDHCISAETAAALRAAYEDPEIRAEALLDQWQDGRCAICERRTMHLVNDHDHVSGLVRLLCP